MRIDAHQHFWQFDPVKHSWINDDMKVIRKNFGPEELSKEIKPLGIEGTIAVQADETEKETSYLLGLADKNEFIKAVVGWIDLRAGNAIERMQYWKQYEKIKEQSKIKQEKADKKKEKEERKGMKAEDTKPKKVLRTTNLEL